MPSLAERLGFDPAKIRAEADASYKKACERNATAVLSGKVAPTITKRDKVPQRKTKTHYLDGEEQRMKQAQLARGHVHILQMLMRDESVRVIATLYGVTDMAIHKRKRMMLDLVRDRGLPVNGHVADEKRLVVEVDDDDAQTQPPAHDLKTGQLFLLGVNRAAPSSVANAVRLRKNANVGPRVAKKLKPHVQHLFYYVW